MEELRCPIKGCGQILVTEYKAPLETLDDHITCSKPSLKSVYTCSSTSCVSHKHKMEWTSDGEYYVQGSIGYSLFVNNNSAPFGTFWRRINAESDRSEDFTLVRFGKVKIDVEWVRKVDAAGNTLSKRPTFKVWVNHELYISGIRMFFYVVTKYFRNRKNYNNDGGSFWKQQIEKDLQPKDWDKRWWSIRSRQVLTTFHKMFPLKEQSALTH